MDEINNSLNFYSAEYVQAQCRKHKERYENHWKNHIRWAKDLVGEYGGKSPAKLLDIGCSVGTYAIEFALDGYETTGLDFDLKALDVARQLAAEENVNPKWLCADAYDFQLSEPVDIVLCFDLLEHLDDNTIKGMLSCIRANLSPDGIFLYHTFPTKYDHIFYQNRFFNRFSSIIPLPLIPFKNLDDSSFTQVVKTYSAFLDLFSLLTVQKTHQQIIKDTVHPNPLSCEKLLNFFNEAGFELIVSMEGIEDFNPLKVGQGRLVMKYFSDKTVARRSLWGVTRISQ